MTPEQELIRDAWILYAIVLPLVFAVVFGGEAVHEWWVTRRRKR